MADRPSRPQRGASAARQKSAAFRAAEAARERRRRTVRWGASVAAVVIVIAVIVVAAVVTHHGKSSPTAASSTTPPAGTPASSSTAAPPSVSATLTGPPGPEGIVLEQGTVLAPVTGAATGQTVDGVQCNSTEQAAQHIHTHLTVYVDGVLRPIPPGVGAVEPVAQQGSTGVFDEASRCYYWLHTHAQDGIIHVEAPTHATFTLGQFFAVWRQPLTATQVGPAHGTLTMFVNGRPYTGDPAAIALGSEEAVQLDVGTPVVPAQQIDWSQAQL